MEYDFKKVHTGKDLTISAIVLLAGAGLFFASKGLGICIVICALFMFLFYKGGYKLDGKDTLLTRKSEDICRACRTSILEFLDGKSITPTITKGNTGGSIRLDVYFNKGVAYAQLFDFNNYAYEPATGIVELKGDRADVLVSQL